MTSSREELDAEFRAALAQASDVTDADRYRAARFLLVRAIERIEEGTIRGQIASKALQYAAEELVKDTAFEFVPIGKPKQESSE